jgi:hypothetical protein
VSTARSCRARDASRSGIAGEDRANVVLRLGLDGVHSSASGPPKTMKPADERVHEVPHVPAQYCSASGHLHSSSYPADAVRPKMSVGWRLAAGGWLVVGKSRRPPLFVGRQLGSRSAPSSFWVTLTASGVQSVPKRSDSWSGQWDGRRAGCPGSATRTRPMRTERPELVASWFRPCLERLRLLVNFALVISIANRSTYREKTRSQFSLLVRA